MGSQSNDAVSHSEMGRLRADTVYNTSEGVAHPVGINRLNTAVTTANLRTAADKAAHSAYANFAGTRLRHRDLFKNNIELSQRFR
jgi:hypothetical protein